MRQTEEEPRGTGVTVVSSASGPRPGRDRGTAYSPGGPCSCLCAHCTVLAYHRFSRARRGLSGTQDGRLSRPRSSSRLWSRSLAMRRLRIASARPGIPIPRDPYYRMAEARGDAGGANRRSAPSLAWGSPRWPGWRKARLRVRPNVRQGPRRGAGASARDRGAKARRVSAAQRGRGEGGLKEAV